jgi:hypothetical protein
MSTSPFVYFAEEVAILTEYARPLAVRDRPRFYEKVSELLRGCEPGPGSMARACRAVQPSFLNSSAIDEKPKPSTQPQRGAFHKRG